VIVVIAASAFTLSVARADSRSRSLAIWVLALVGASRLAYLVAEQLPEWA